MGEIYHTTVEAVMDVSWLRENNPNANETGWLRILLKEGADKERFIQAVYMNIIRTWETNEYLRSLRCILKEKYRVHLLEEMYGKAIQDSAVLIPLPILLQKQDGILFSCLENGEMLRGKKIFIIP